ncbi:MAG: sodium-dependent bicarbonate transport family permease [Planctomycetes bacterium]|nr:sodium-dependent bicarbonate transport family permease [Planctomycetota bacterium]
MDWLEALQANATSPAVLFFALGFAAAVLRSDLRIPDALYVTLTIYLLCAIGLKGGVALSGAPFSRLWLPLLAAIALGAAIPLWSYALLRRALGFSQVDAAAIGAHYGSVSAFTFVAASNYLQSIGVPFPGESVAFLAVMESPAILVGIWLGRRGSSAERTRIGEIVREALLGRSVLLLLGSLLIGVLAGKRGMAQVEGFFVAPFQGVLCLFLLELGLVAGRRCGDLRQVGPRLLVFGLAAPLVHGALGAWLGTCIGLDLGGATLFGVLAASASYIAAPAAIRQALPDASPTLYLTAALVVTFPFNLAVGIPYVYALARALSS